MLRRPKDATPSPPAQQTLSTRDPQTWCIFSHHKSPCLRFGMNSVRIAKNAAAAVGSISATTVRNDDYIMNSIVAVLGERCILGASILPGLPPRKVIEFPIELGTLIILHTAVNALARHQTTVLRSDRVGLRASALGEAPIEGASPTANRRIRSTKPERCRSVRPFASPPPSKF
jgi:hypothetical protein